MKKEFQNPVMDIIKIEDQDCIVTSNEVGGATVSGPGMSGEGNNDPFFDD